MPNASRRGTSRWAAAVLLALLVVGALVALALGAGGGSGSTGWRPAARLRGLMRLMRTPARPAPPFSLTDQNGRRVSLGELHGKVVVVEAMDPRCEDLCPIVSQDFVDADRALGAAASRIAFVGFNVNQFHAGIRDVLAFSRQHGLEALPNWHFLTGSTPELKRVWDAYSIGVEPNPAGDVVHTALMEFIDPAGRTRWVAQPDYNEAAIPEWGRGIATVARHLLG